VPAVCRPGLDFDQRGYAPPYGNDCDVGAVEVTDGIAVGE